MLGNRRAKKILAIDWDARTLRLVHASIGKRGATIDRLLAVGLPAGMDPSDPQQMGGHGSLQDECGHREQVFRPTPHYTKPGGSCR